MQETHASWLLLQKEMKDSEGCEQEQSSVTSAQLRLSAPTQPAMQRPTGAFLPFLREQPGSTSVLSRPTPRNGSGADLSLSLGDRVASPSGDRLRASDSEVGSIDVGLRTPDAQIAKDMLVSNGTSAAAGSSSGGNSSRKARRCWSPELHRRFVNALHQLGGSQSAFLCFLMPDSASHVVPDSVPVTISAIVRSNWDVCLVCALNWCVCFSSFMCM